MTKKPSGSAGGFARLALAVAGSACLVAAAHAHPPDGHSGVQVLKPGELGRADIKPHGHPQPPAVTGGRQPSQVPGTGHQHIRQRGEYGEGYRYGHSVNGPHGNITIWSPSTRKPYGGQRPTFGPGKTVKPRPHPPTGPKLDYRPDYGNPPEDRD